MSLREMFPRTRALVCRALDEFPPHIRADLEAALVQVALSAAEETFTAANRAAGVVFAAIIAERTAKDGSR